MAHLGEKLKEFRGARDWSQPEMAKYLGFAYRTYQELERTGDVKKVDDLRAIAQKTGLITLKYAWEEDRANDSTLSDVLKRLARIEEYLLKNGMEFDAFGEEPGPAHKSSKKR
ncbi:MAG TPA: helix-turn-helix transcriptional regulator [Chitinophagaceae bacterium]|nr:helix-turn-helix transcriptional regulator [Chitinophagaceae bacterium]